MSSSWRRLASRWRLLSGLAVDEALIQPEDRTHFGEHTRAVMADNVVRAGGAILFAALVWWPLDLVVFADRPHVKEAFAWMRGLVAVTLVALYAVGRATGGLETRTVPFIATALVLGFGIAGFAMGRAGGLDGPWFHYLYVGPIFTVAVLVPLRVRAGLLTLIIAAMVLAFLAGAPQHLGHADLVPSLSYLVFVGLLALAIGHAGYLLTLATFVERERTARSEAEVRHLNDSLAARVAAQTAELRALANHVETLREEERRWMAREIHDELGQELMALRYAVHFARGHADADPTRVAPALAEVDRLLARSDQTLRRILRSLRPRVLDDLGLTAALRWLADETSSRSGLTCAATLPADDAPAIPPEVALAAFRIAQEALTNVARHAGASRADLTLRVTGDTLHLAITDDGVGLTAPAPGPDALGLVGIRERTAALGGHAAWTCAPTGGTTVTVTLPLAHPGAAP